MNMTQTPDTFDPGTMVAYAPQPYAWGQPAYPPYQPAPMPYAPQPYAPQPAPTPVPVPAPVPVQEAVPAPAPAPVPAAPAPAAVPAVPPVGSLARLVEHDHYHPDGARDRVLLAVVVGHSWEQGVPRVQALRLGYLDEALDVPLSELR